MITVVPSLPAATYSELAALANALKGVSEELQVDIVDGEFVPAVSWPFTEPDPLDALARMRELTSDFRVGMDCMVLDPAQYFDQFAELGVVRVVLHFGCTDDLADAIERARAHGFKIGVAFTNDVPLADVDSYIDQVDFVQIMGIAEIGKQGQPFDERTLDTARALREKYPTLEIAVDGSVNADTIAILKEAGINRFAPGSAVAKQDDPAAAYRQLCALVM